MLKELFHFYQIKRSWEFKSSDIFHFFIMSFCFHSLIGTGVVSLLSIFHTSCTHFRQRYQELSGSMDKTEFLSRQSNELQERKEK